MIRTLPRQKGYTTAFRLYIILFYIFLFAPLVITCILAFNDSNFPSLPWKGFSLDWFVADGPDRIGLLHDSSNLQIDLGQYPDCLMGIDPVGCGWYDGRLSL